MSSNMLNLISFCLFYTLSLVYNVCVLYYTFIDIIPSEYIPNLFSKPYWLRLMVSFSSTKLYIFIYILHSIHTIRFCVLIESIKWPNDVTFVQLVTGQHIKLTYLLLVTYSFFFLTIFLFFVLVYRNMGYSFFCRNHNFRRNVEMEWEVEPYVKENIFFFFLDKKWFIVLFLVIGMNKLKYMVFFIFFCL